MQKQGRRFSDITLMILLLAAGGLLGGCKDELPADQRWQASVTRQIVSNHELLAKVTQKTADQAASFCASPTDAGLSKLRSRWRQGMDGWQRLQWVIFGPLADNDNRAAFQSWPQGTDLAGNVQQLLQSRQPITPGTLAIGSHVLRGLDVQELLLFDPAFATTESLSGRPCQLLLASSHFTAERASHLIAQWQQKNWLIDWFLPLLRDNATAGQLRNSELMAALQAQIHLMAENKLAAPLGLQRREHESDSAKPDSHKAESWRSQHSLANLIQNLKSLQQLVTPDEGYGLFLFLKDRQQLEVAEALIIKLDNVHLALQQMTLPLEKALTDAEGQTLLLAAHQSLRDLALFVERQVMPALGLVEATPAESLPQAQETL